MSLRYFSNIKKQDESAKFAAAILLNSSFTGDFVRSKLNNLKTASMIAPLNRTIKLKQILSLYKIIKINMIQFNII